jgi:hypothetical protein
VTAVAQTRPWSWCCVYWTAYPSNGTAGSRSGNVDRS